MVPTAGCPVVLVAAPPVGICPPERRLESSKRKVFVTFCATSETRDLYTGEFCWKRGCGAGRWVTPVDPSAGAGCVTVPVARFCLLGGESDLTFAGRRFVRCALPDIVWEICDIRSGIRLCCAIISISIHYKQGINHVIMCINVVDNVVKKRVK